MMALEIETLFTKDDWNRVLECFDEYDFVHTFDFHHVSQENGEGLPIIFAVRDGNGSYVACWPALRREIPGTSLFDLTSVYGYAGPLLTGQEGSEQCLNLIFDAMRKMGIVTLFSRMHPLFVEQIDKLELRGERLGDVIVIDVQHQKPLVSYRAGHRYEIRKALASGVKIHVDHQCESISQFINIYQQTMLDLNASTYYSFNEDYFEKLKGATEFKPFILFAELDSKKIAASMFIVTGRLMQYYLSGTVGEHRRLSPSKAIIASAHEIAKSMGIEKIILGGGVGSREDQLFQFKNGFSDRRMPFYVFKKIIIDSTYTALCEERGSDPTVTGYFPAYRLP
jgi:hypothetical protein